MPDDPKVEYQENVPQERGQDADLFGEQNKVPDAEDQQFWSGDGKDDQLRGTTDEASVESLPADVKVQEHAQVGGHLDSAQATYGSMGQGGLPASGATVDPTRTTASPDKPD